MIHRNRIGTFGFGILIILLFGILSFSSVMAASTGSSDSSQSGTRTITDMAGNTVDIPANIERVADLWHAHNEVMLMLGAGDKIVATTSNIKAMPFFKKIYPQINDIPAAQTGSGTGDISMETLVSTKPDIVILSSATNETQEKLTSAGIPTVIVTFTNFDELKKAFLLSGSILGDSEKKKADKYITYLDSKLSSIKDISSKIPADKKLSVVHIQSMEPLKIDGSNTIIDSWINVAGGVNAAAKDVKGNMQQITFEQLQAMNPDAIIIGGTMKDKDTIMNDPKWQALKAVKDGKVYVNPKGVFPWDRYGAEEALQIQWAAKTLYPDLFTNLNINEELKQFYKNYFDYSLTDDDVESIINPTA
jgi:iron complex transport system substrate-binding protein